MVSSFRVRPCFWKAQKRLNGDGSLDGLDLWELMFRRGKYLRHMLYFHIAYM